jgi:uncharacterized repeat protein (TIGR01451 family)
LSGDLSRASLTTLIAFLFPWFAPLAMAQEGSSPIEVTATAELREEIATADGRRVARFVPAVALKQGDELYFTLRIRNLTSVIAPNVTVTWPIPAHTSYREGSASGPAAHITFSADGGANFAPAGQVQKTDSTGTVRKARPDEYTHIRWRLRYSLAPGAVAIARFRAVFQ